MVLALTATDPKCHWATCDHSQMARVHDTSSVQFTLATGLTTDHLQDSHHVQVSP